MPKKSKAKDKYLSYFDLNKVYDDKFQKTIRQFCVTNPMGIEQLVSERSSRKYAYRLMDLLDNFVVRDDDNDITVTVCLEQYSYNSATKRGLAKLNVTSEYKLKNDSYANSVVMFKTINCDNDGKPCALSIFEDVLDVISTLANTQYYEVLKTIGISVGGYYD